MDHITQLLHSLLEESGHDLEIETNLSGLCDKYSEYIFNKMDQMGYKK